LKHQAEAALFGRQFDAIGGIEESAVADGNRSTVRRFQPGNGAQQRCLAAA
jgi:hypothetical protein